MVLCEVCGGGDACTCPPCACKWCREARGEALSEPERLGVMLHSRGLRRDAARTLARDMTERMRASLARHKNSE